MRINTRQKGRRNEFRCAKMLEDVGYEVQLAPNPTRWSTQNDLFGLWDVVCVREKEIRWIQVKTNRKPTQSELEPYRAWRCYGSKEIWIFYDGEKEPSIMIL